MGYWEIKLKSKDVGEIYIYGEIASSKHRNDDTTPTTIATELKALGDIKILNVYINSGGGSAFAGSAIYNILLRHSAKKVVYVDGLAASAASIIAMAGDEIIIPKNAMMMIHKAWAFAYGNSDELINIADLLDKVDTSMVGVYSEKTKIPENTIKEMMKAETWMSGDEAVSMGFATKLAGEQKVVASIKGNTAIFNNVTVDVSQYKQFPIGSLPEHKEDIKVDNDRDIQYKILFS